MTAGNRNILLLSAGRRVSLARGLAASAGAIGSQLVTADMNPAMSAACQDNAVYAALPHAMSEAYPAALCALCAAHKIGLVIPTIDTELAILAGLRADLARQGTEVVVCDPALIEASRDKRQTAAFFQRFGIASPQIQNFGHLQFPVIAKPFDGSLSRDISILRSAADLTEKVRTVPNIMFADYLDQGIHDEFTCDAYYTRAGQLACVVPRQRLEVRGGEVSKARAVRNDIVALFFSKLGQIDGARGCLTFQFFRHRETGEHWLIELNARFGGGYPLTMAAGAVYHDWLVREYLLQETVQPWHGWTDGLTMLRYDAEVLVNG